MEGSRLPQIKKFSGTLKELRAFIRSDDVTTPDAFNTTSRTEVSLPLSITSHETEIVNEYSDCLPEIDPYERNATDSFDMLADTIREIDNTNNNIINQISDRIKKRTTLGYSYDVQCKMSSDVTDNDRPWEVTAKRGTTARSIADSWRYTGNKLDEVDDYFNDKVNYRIRSLSDLKRLNTDLVNVGLKYADFMPDRPNTRSAVYAHISNLQTIQKALKEVHRNSSGDNNAVKEKIEKYMIELKIIWDKIQSLVPNAELRINTRGKTVRWKFGLEDNGFL